MAKDRITFRIPEELREDAEELAESQSRTLSNLMVWLLDREVQAYRWQRTKEARERDERTMQAIHECAKKLGIGEAV